jgi:hypothetical protein
MPKRIIDGDSLWRSEKLARVEPASFRAELANLIPLSLANGVFEADPRLVWARVYVFNREDVTLAMVEQMLDEFERRKILFRWKDEKSGKVWGFWVGIDRPGRLPGPSRKGKHEVVGPNPPATELFDFERPSTESNGIRSGIHSGITTGNPDETSVDFDGRLGSGSGSGSGTGLEKGLENSKTLPRIENQPAKPTAKPTAKPKSECAVCHSTTKVIHEVHGKRYCDSCWGRGGEKSA